MAVRIPGGAVAAAACVDSGGVSTAKCSVTLSLASATAYTVRGRVCGG